MTDSHAPNPAHTVAVPPTDPNATAPGTTRPTSGDFALGAPAAAGELGVFGPYRVLKELGRGGMGAVYLAVDTRLNRKIALKVMLPEFAAHAESNARFLREARAAALVEHAHVVTVYEADECDGVPYIAMQFLQGYPLDEYLKKKGAPPLAHAVRIAREAALGLAAAHERGLVHRDIKPANLWLEAPNGRVKVLDFGLAKPVGSASDLTATGAVVGSPAYMSPEQARGQKVDARADIFSLGVVLYQLLTGRKPFDGEHALAVLAAILTDEPKPVRELNAAVPAALADLVHQMLAKEPAARPQTAAEVAERLRTVFSQPDLSHGASGVQPVAVPVPQPLHVTVAPQSAFADLLDGTGDRTERDADPHARAPKRGSGLLLARGALALAALVAVAVALALGTGAKKPDVTAKNPDPTPAPPPVVKPNDVEKPPTNPKPGETYDLEVAPNTKMRFCWVPAGECKLGIPATEHAEVLKIAPWFKRWLDLEVEDRRGTFRTDGFWMGKYEVTQAEWAAVMRGTTLEAPSAFRAGGEAASALGAITDTRTFPVDSVSWNDCQQFLSRANAHGYVQKAFGRWAELALPEENAWEYACRGGLGNRRPYFWGHECNGTQANVMGTFPFGTTEQGPNLKRTTHVGSYEKVVPHPWGLCDTHGNLNEWTVTPFDNPGDYRVRGGEWSDDAGGFGARAARQGKWAASHRSPTNGLRVVVSAK